MLVVVLVLPLFLAKIAFAENSSITRKGRFLATKSDELKREGFAL